MQHGLPPLISTGNTADVHAWKHGQVLKLFHTGIPLEAITREHRISSAVYVTGIPVPRVGDIVAVDNRYGIEYEYVQGTLLSRHLKAHPLKAFQFADMVAELHAQIHQCTDISGLPSQKEKLTNKIERARRISEDTRERILLSIENMPIRTSLCHGDFHLNNIILTDEGPKIIDWMDASVGDPQADVARTEIIYRGFVATTKDPNWIERTGAALYLKRYLSKYLGRAQWVTDDYKKWLPIVAAARLTEGITELQDWLIKQVE